MFGKSREQVYASSTRLDVVHILVSHFLAFGWHFRMNGGDFFLAFATPEATVGKAAPPNPVRLHGVVKPLSWGYASPPSHKRSKLAASPFVGRVPKYNTVERENGSEAGMLDTMLVSCTGSTALLECCGRFQSYRLPDTGVLGCRLVVFPSEAYRLLRCNPTTSHF